MSELLNEFKAGRPYRPERGFCLHGTIWYGIVNKNGTLLSKAIWLKEQAEHICQCVNNFDKLLEACKRIKGHCDNGGRIDKETTGLYNCLKVAIAEAEKES